MVTWTLMLAFLCTCSWISVSVSQFHTVEAQPGGEVTLMCSNRSSRVAHIFWFRLSNTPNISRVSSMQGSDANASFHDGFKKGKFDMTSNTSTIFLRIKDVNSADSGLYFCGSPPNGKPEIFSGTYLKVQEAFDGMTKLNSGILHALIILILLVLLVILLIFCLGFKIHRLLQTAHEKEETPQHSQNLGSDNLNYAALSFHPKAKSHRQPASEDQHTVYAATR